MSDAMRITILGLSITSSWGNGHATNYRGLGVQLLERGHDVLFLERDRPWYASNRDLTGPMSPRTRLYSELDELKDCFAERVRESDVVIVGSYVPDGVAVGEWVTETAQGVTAFYDIDTPVTLARLAREDREYLSPELVPRYDLYLSFAGGTSLRTLSDRYGARRPRAFYCCFDPDRYWPEECETRWDLAYLGTYSPDRQPPLEQLMLAAAERWAEGRFAVVGPQYPESLRWPGNVERLQHLPPAEHRGFYRAQRYTLNLTRADMVRAGHSPSVRLFEAAGCGTPVISDYWTGLEDFFEIGTEILVARSPREVLHFLTGIPEDERVRIGEAARRRVLGAHTAAHRAAELERHVSEAREEGAGDGVRMGASVEAGVADGAGGAGSAGGPGTKARSVRGAAVGGGGGLPSDPIRREILELAPWFHNLHLGDGVQTAPDHGLGDFPGFKWNAIAPSLPGDLSGWRVLDVGCNAGFYAFELARRGAYVLGIDSSEHYLRQARWAADILDLADRAEFRRMQVYDLARLDESSFDLVVFMGVLYHLRYPTLAMDLLTRKVGRLMVFQSLTMPGEEVREDTSVRRLTDRAALGEPGWPVMAFVEETLAGDPTNWWVPNHACVLALLRSCGMRVTERPGHEIYVCEPDPAVQRVRPDEKEYAAAIGIGRP